MNINNFSYDEINDSHINLLMNIRFMCGGLWRILYWLSFSGRGLYAHTLEFEITFEPGRHAVNSV